MESVQSANVDSAKFLALDKFKATTTNPKWNCCDFTLKMLEDGVYTDITFNAKGGSVKAHKSVLACVSPVFNAMFQHDMKEQLTSIVQMPDMSVEALQLFLLLLYTTNEMGHDEKTLQLILLFFYTTNKVDNEVVVEGYQEMILFNAFAEKHSADIHKTVLLYQMPHFSVAIDEHFDEFYKAVLMYQVETRLGFVLISALGRNLTLENCWYYYVSSEMAAPGPFKNSANAVCFDYILGNYHDVIKSKCFLEEMKSNPIPVQRVIKHAESQDRRKNALENYLRIKSL